jgi:hypothetical protein
VRLDRLRAEEEGGTGLAVRRALPDEERDLELLGRELAKGGALAAADGLAGRVQLGARAVHPRDGPERLEGNWLAGGWFGRRQLRTWFSALGDRLAEVEVDGERAHVLAKDLNELASARPTGAVRLLPGFDQYVLGPGTAHGHVVPTPRRAAVSKQAGWISPVVVAGGGVGGTWELDGDRVRVAWFREAGTPPRTALETEVTRLSSILDRGLRSVISVA